MRKAVLNKNHTFEWIAPYPILGTPTLLLNSISYDLSQSRTSATVSAIASDRRTLTINNQATGLERNQMKAFLLTSGDTFYQVSVVRVVGTTAILAEPLPREIDLSTSATLEFSLWSVILTSSITVLTTANTYPFQIDYVADLGSNTQNKVEKGLLKSVNRPFNTGLSHDDLINFIAPLADMIPRRQSDFAPQIKAAQDELILVIRDVVLADDATEDEVFNPEQFKLAHAYCTAAMIYEQNLQLDVADQMRSRCKDLLDIALRSLALDVDGDGVIDQGELDRRETGGKQTDFRASYKGYTRTSYDSFFTATRGMKH
tara:strand:- start:13059 stop:14006 length:948 start_codon:yes stop_codon:yes gene_type:complete